MICPPILTANIPYPTLSAPPDYQEYDWVILVRRIADKYSHG